MKKFSGRTAAIIIWAVVWVFFMFGSGIVERVVNPEVGILKRRPEYDYAIF